MGERTSFDLLQDLDNQIAIKNEQDALKRTKKRPNENPSTSSYISKNSEELSSYGNLCDENVLLFESNYSISEETSENVDLSAFEVNLTAEEEADMGFSAQDPIGTNGLFSAVPSRSRDEISVNTINDFCMKLRRLLARSIDGKTLLRYADTNICLTDALRGKLVELIVNEELNTHANFKVPLSTFKAYSLAIQQLFFAEKSTIYYTDYVYFNKGKKKGLKGKLCDKYSNKRTALRRLNLIPPIRRPVEKVVEVAPEETADEESQHEDISWLQNNEGPWSVVLKKWQATFSGRRNLLRSLQDTQLYIEKFPSLQSSQQGYLLILEDFKHLHAAEANNFLKNWNDTARRIVEYSKTKINIEKSWNKLIRSHGIILEDITGAMDAQIVALKLIPFLLPPPAIYNTKNWAGKWKPSRLESMQGLLLEIPSERDFDNVLSERHEKRSRFGLKAYPSTVIVNHEGANKSYVNIGLTRYQMPSVMEAFDCTFKSFFVLKEKFPPESFNACIFLQKYVYRIPIHEVNFSAGVERLAASLKL